MMGGMVVSGERKKKRWVWRMRTQFADSQGLRCGTRARLKGDRPIQVNRRTPVRKMRKGGGSPVIW